MGKMGASDICVVRMQGARSGKWRDVPLMYVPNGDGVILVASLGGAPKNPVWYYNLVAHPDIEVQVKQNTLKLRARLASARKRPQCGRVVSLRIRRTRRIRSAPRATFRSSFANQDEQRRAEMKSAPVNRGVAALMLSLCMLMQSCVPPTRTAPNRHRRRHSEAQAAWQAASAAMIHGPSTIELRDQAQLAVAVRLRFRTAAAGSGADAVDGQSTGDDFIGLVFPESAIANVVRQHPVRRLGLRERRRCEELECRRAAAKPQRRHRSRQRRTRTRWEFLR